MPPLSQALSRTSASGGALQTKVVDSSKQWTPPASGHPNTSPADLIHPQAQAGNERKPSVHKQARKNEEATLEARQNLERDNEPAGPQQELTAGVVDNTNPVERSSTTSNSEGRLSRSASIASEVFSHQSSRPSTNNTSRSSVNPATGSVKTTPVHVSSITALLGPTNVRLKPDHPTKFSTPIQETILETTTPSAPTLLTPDTLRLQNNGLNRRISYMTDVGNTKESLTGRLKLKLYRLKTDLRYIDSFGDGNLPQVDGLRQWELAGTAKLKWEDVLKPAIILTMNNNHTAIYGNQLEVRHPRLECTMIGKTAQQANPLVRVTHKKKSVCEKLAKLAEKLDVVKQSGFWVTHRQAQNFRAKWELTAPPQARFQQKTSLVPLSGAQLVVAGNQKRSTIGAVVDTDGRRYGLTVSHVFSDETSDSSEAEYVDDGQSSDNDESEEWTCDYDEDEFKAWMELEDSSTASNTQSPSAATYANEEISWKRQMYTDTGPKWSSVNQDFDWALVGLGEYEYRATNESIYGLETPSASDFLTQVASSPLTTKSDLLVVTRRGNLVAVAGESVSNNEWPIQLRQGEFELGDSGSLVVNATNGAVYGILLSGDPLFGSGYVAPAINIQADLQQTIRADLQYGEESRQLWPDRQFDVSILPEQYEMLPSKYNSLLDAARIGDFRSISRLIHTESTPSKEAVEQKKPSVEAAKRYNALTPIAEIIKTDSNKNGRLDLSSVRQLDEFYRSAAHNGFRGEEADLEAKECFVRILLGRGVDLKDFADVEGTALHQAAEDGNLEVVKALARDPEDTEYINFRRHNCWSPLHLATREGHVDVVEFLMSHGADVAALSGSEDTREDSVLQIAAWKGNPSVIKTLLDQKATTVSDRGRFGGPMRAAVLSAGRLYNEEMCRIEQNEQKKRPHASLDDIRFEREAKDKLFAIAERYHPSSTETLVVKLEPKLLSDTLPSRSAILQSVLNILTRFGNSALASRKSPFSAMLAWGSTIFELLLANEASQDFEATDKDLEQAFLVAAEEGPSLLAGVLDDILHKRLAAGRMREIRSKALCLAASTGELSTVDILLRKSIDVNFKDDDGWTALQLAADAGHLKIVQRLCQQKAALEKRGSGHQTALTCAAASNKSDASLILEFLLKRHADAKAKTRRRGNGINMAARLGNERSVELLLARGVSAEIRTVRDGTPLEVASIRNYTDVVQILLKHLDAKDAEDYLQEAMQSAAVYGSFDTVKLLLDEHPGFHIKGKLLAKVVKSSWVTGGVVDILRKHHSSKDMQSRLRILQKAATNWRHATFALPLHPYSGDTGPPSSIAACLLQHEDDQTLDVPEEIFIALAENTDEATLSLLMKKSRQLQITGSVLAAAAGNVFHGDTVLPLLLKACPSSLRSTLTPQQSTPILKAAVGNRELGVSMLELVRDWLPAHASRIEDCIFVEAAGNPFHGRALIERLLQFLLMIPYQGRAHLVVNPVIVRAAAQNWYVIPVTLLKRFSLRAILALTPWYERILQGRTLIPRRSSGDLVLQTLLESTYTTFTQEAAVEVILRFTEQGKDMDLERYDVDVLSLLLKRKEVFLTPDIMTLVMKHADRKTVEMFEKEQPVSNEASDIEIEQQIIAAASNMDHGPELVEYLLETRKGIALTERLLDIAAERDEENEPNKAGNLMMTAFFKSDAAVAIHEFENLLDTVVRDFNFETVEALLGRKTLQLKVTRFTLEQAVQNPKATKELLKMLLEYAETIMPESTDTMTEPGVVAIVEDLTSSPDVEIALALVPDPIEPGLQDVLKIQGQPEQAAAHTAGRVATEEPSCTETQLVKLKGTASEGLATDNQVNVVSDTNISLGRVDARVDEFVMMSAAKNVERGKELVEVLLNYSDATILTERVIKAAVSNRKQAWEIVKLFNDHANPDTLEAKGTSRMTEKANLPEQVEIQPNTAFWTGRITRRIFQAAMRNWTENGNSVLLQLLKNDLKTFFTQDMFLEIIRQHKLAVVKELFANHSSSFPLKEDIAEDMLSAAAANWTAGVKVFRFVINEAKELAARIIPRSEKVAVAIASNWKSGKEVLDTLLRRYKLCITERVLISTARNPYSGADIMKVLMRNYTGRISVDLLKAAAENFDDGVPLLKLLLKRGGYTRIPDEVLSAIAGNGSCGPEMLELLIDGNYVFYLTESTLLAAARNSVATRVFMVSPVTPGRDIEMTTDLLLQQRDKMKNGNQLLKPPLQYGGIVCLVNMYASRWQECNVLWGLKNGVSEDETWVRRENDWVWGTGRAMLLDLLENHWIPGDFVPDSVLDLATRNFDAEVIRALLQKRDKPITERQLLNATSNELYAHEVVMELLAEKQLLPPDSITADVLESAARNPQCGGQMLEVLWTEKSEVTEDLLDAAAGNASQGEALIAFLLAKGAKVTTALLETSVDNENQGSMVKMLFEKCDHENLIFTAKIITSAAENQSIGDELVKEFLQRHPKMEILDEFMLAAAANPGCGAKIMKILLQRKPFSEVKDVDDVLVSAARNPKQAIRLLSMLLEKDQAVSRQVWKAAVENPEIAFEVVSFLVDRKVPAPIPDDIWVVAVSAPNVAMELLGLLHKQHGELKIDAFLFHAALNNWKSGLEVLQWMKRVATFEYDVDRALDLAARNVGCGIEIVNSLLAEHKPAQISPGVWVSAATNLGCGDVLISRLLEYAGNQVELDQPLLLQAAAGNLMLSEQIFRALSNVHTPPDSPTKILEDVVLILINNWKSGEATIKFLKNSPKWTLAITDVLLQMIVQNTPDDEGALAVLLEGVDEFEFPEMPDAVSPFWLVRSLKAIELLVIKIRRSSLPQELVKKVTGGWRADAISRILDGVEITQDAFANSATNPLNDGQITKMLQEANPELVVTDEMLQKAVANNIEIAKTILDMGQRVSQKALEASVKGDNTSILELLLGTDTEMKISDFVLEAAISNGSPKILRILLQRGLENPLSDSALCKAAEKEDNLEIMKVLLAQFAGKASTKADIPQVVLDEAIDESNVSMVQLLLDNNVATPFTEHTWAKAMGENSKEIIQMLLQHDPHFEVTDHILKRAIKSANIYATKLLLERDPNLKMTQRMMERVAKCRDVEMLKICVAHIPNKESFIPTERFIERAACNSLEMITAVLEQWPSLQMTATIFERVVKDVDVEVLDFLLDKFPNLPFSTRTLVAAASVTNLETFRKILDHAKQQSIIPNTEVFEAVFSRLVLIGPPPPPGAPPPPPGYFGNNSRLEFFKLVLEANEDCITENVLQSAFRQDSMDVETFKLIFLHRPWPLRLIQSEFKTMMRQRPIPTKVKFLLEQETYDLKILPATFTNAAEHFSEHTLCALFESSRAKDCPMAPDLLDIILRGTVSSSSPAPELSHGSPWQTTRIDTCVLQKMKVVLTYREVEITMKHVIQAQSLRKTGRQIIQLFLDSPEKAKMTDDVRNYASSVCVVKQLSFKPQSRPTDEGVAIEIAEDHRIPGSGDPSGIASVYSDDDSDSVGSYSSSSDGAAHSLDTLDDSENKRSRENEHPLTYSLPFESYKSGIAVEPTWTSHAEPAVFEQGA